MTVISYPHRIGTGPGAHGFSGVCGISAMAAADTPKRCRKNDGNKFTANGAVMKTAEINWDLFWRALSQQTTERKNSWLGRWAFTDDRVRLSMQPARTDMDDPDSQA
jgi:hypothetical protein